MFQCLPHEMLCVSKDKFCFFPLLPGMEIQSQVWEQTTSLSAHISSPRLLKTWRSKCAPGDTSPTTLPASDGPFIGVLPVALSWGPEKGLDPDCCLCCVFFENKRKNRVKEAMLFHVIILHQYYPSVVKVLILALRTRRELWSTRQRNIKVWYCCWQVFVLWQ